MESPQSEPRITSHSQLTRERGGEEEKEEVGKL
jgi:hypothetical protein